MSADRLEARLAELLSSPEITVGTGVAAVGGATTAAAVAVERVVPTASMASRLPGELRHRELRRVSPVTMRAVVSVAPGSVPDARARALETASLLWWRCEDTSIATGKAFPFDDMTEGYRVLDVRPAGWTAPSDGSLVHRIELDIDALLWPRALPPVAGREIEHVLLRLSAEHVAAPVRVAVSGKVDVTVDVDLRSLAVQSTNGSAAPRAVLVSVLPRGETPAGAVPGAPILLAGTTASVRYSAGAAPGRDELRWTIAEVTDGGITRGIPVGSVDVEVVP